MGDVLDRFLTVTEAAKLMAVDVSTVRRWCGSGKLPARKIGATYVIRRRDLKAFSRPPRGNPNFIRNRAN